MNGHIKIKIHPVCVLLWIVTAIWGSFLGMAACMGALFIHEFGHILCRILLDSNTGIRITVFPFGGVIYQDRQCRNALSEVLVALAGPMANWAMIMLLGCLSTRFNAKQGIVLVLFYGQLQMLLLNLLPAFPFDGGTIVLFVLRRWFSFYTSMKILITTGICISCGFILMTVGVYFSSGLINLSLVLTACVLLYMTLWYQKQVPALCLMWALHSKLGKHKEKPMERLRVYAIDSSCKLLNIIEILSDKSTLFVIRNKGQGNVFLDEKTMLKGLIEYEDQTVQTFLASLNCTKNE